MAYVSQETPVGSICNGQNYRACKSYMDEKLSPTFNRMLDYVIYEECPLACWWRLSQKDAKDDIRG
jgi:hypothetical protein